MLQSKSMAKNSIVEKINAFLLSHPALTEEYQAIYVMVELRKILDHDRAAGVYKFDVLRFYCDWTVHTSKDRFSSNMKATIKDLLEDIRLHLQNPVMIRCEKTINFVYMNSLRTELRQLLQNESIDMQIVGAGWNSFLKVLVKVLEDQPIIKPIPEVKSVTFLPAASDCAIFKIDFTSPVAGKTCFQLGNAY
ncbi:hypothetical protein KBD34_05340 [Patescibacteria group bacterium]|nr:hypothetical protein [Patescibacteria group bacterium]